MKTGKFEPRGRGRSSGLRISALPIEWLDGRNWRLPSGKCLAEFFMQAGFVAPLLLKAEQMKAPLKTARASADGAAAAPVHSGKDTKQGRGWEPISVRKTASETARGDDHRATPLRDYR